MLYHVSPVRNHTSIIKTGIEPALARTNFKASWYVTSEKLAWALAHCSVRHNLPVSELEVWFIPQGQFKKRTNTRWPGVFTTFCNNFPQGFLSAQEILEELK